MNRSLPPRLRPRFRGNALAPAPGGPRLLLSRPVLLPRLVLLPGLVLLPPPVPLPRPVLAPGPVLLPRLMLLTLLVLLAAACSGDRTPAGGSAAGGAGAAQALDSLQSEVYEREIVFLSAPGDSTLIIPWLFRSSTVPDGVEREARALLARAGTWDPFLQLRWQGPPTRSPWRLLPSGPLRLVVGEDDALERFVFREGNRSLELLFGETLTEWAGLRGEVYRLQDATILLANQQLDGLLLDIGRGRRGEDAPHGDWIFLTGPGDFQLFLDDPGGGGADADRYRAWTRTGFREVQWPAVDVEWTEVRAFDRARRDVPWGWSVTSSDQQLTGELTVRAAHLAAGDGPGPLLPVDGLYEVSGRIAVAGTNHVVRGLVRHSQP